MGLRKRTGLSTTDIQREVIHALDLVDLPDAISRVPPELSGGMRKRVGIARAIALRPKYILYDEPTTGLDPVTSAVIDDLMIRMQRTLGVTSIVITHDIRSAYRVGTRIAMLYEGRVRRIAFARVLGAIAQPTRHPVALYVFEIPLIVIVRSAMSPIVARLTCRAPSKTMCS